MQYGRENVKDQWRAQHEPGVRRIAETWHQLGVEHTIDQRRQRDDKANQWAGCADVEQCAIGADGGADQNEGSQRANQRGEGNEERVAGVNVMMPAGEEVRQLMHQQNSEQSKREWQPGDESSRVLIQQSEIVEKFFEREGFAVSISDRKLRTGDKTGAESHQEETESEEEGLERRMRMNETIVRRRE